MNIETPFTTGGPVHISEEKIYVTREADNQLLNYCLNNEFSVILTARQMGKTSLLFHTISDLKKHNIDTVYIDLNKIGTGGVSVDDWYKSVLDIIQDELNLHIDVEEYWNRLNSLAHGMRFSRFISDLASKSVKPIIIFIDEIELTTQLEYSDSFFAVIRSLYTERGSNSDLKKISFVLSGMARVSDLIKQPDITTFNIGKRINLECFTKDELNQLLKTIRYDQENSELILSWILKWTGGQPYLTQLLFEKLSRSNSNIHAEEQIESEALNLISQPEVQDKHTNTIQRYLIGKPSVNIILGIYALILLGKKIDHSEEIVGIQYLKLSGLLVPDDTILRISNNIYKNHFDLNWVEQQLKNLRTSLDVAITIAQNLVENKNENINSNPDISKDESNNKLSEINQKAREKDRNRRSFLIAAGILGGIILITLACLTGIYLFSRTATSENIDPVTAPVPSVDSGSQPTTSDANLGYMILIGMVVIIVLLIIGLVVSTDSQYKGNKWALRRRSLLIEKIISEEYEFLVKESLGWGDKIFVYLSQADLKFKIAEFLALIISSGVYSLIIAYFISQDTFIAPIIGFLLGLFLPFIYINSQIDQRLHSFVDSLPDSLYNLVNGINSGYSIIQSIESMTKTGFGIVQQEFERVVWELKINVKQSLALSNMLERIPSSDLSAVVGAINLQREVGIRVVDAFDSIRLRTEENKRVSKKLFKFPHLHTLVIIEYAIIFMIFGDDTSVIISTTIGRLLFLMNVILLTYSAILLNQQTRINNVIYSLVLLILIFLLPVNELFRLHLIVLLITGLGSSYFYWFLMKENVVFKKAGYLIVALLASIIFISSLSAASSTFNNSTANTSFIAIILGLLGVMITIAVAIFARRNQDVEEAKFERAYREYSDGNSLMLSEFELAYPFMERVIIPILQHLGTDAIKFTPHYSFIETERKLQQGGNPLSIDTATFLSLRFVTAGIGFLGINYLVSVFSLQFDIYVFCLYSIFCILGYMAPEVWINNIIQERKKDIEYELPYAVDLLKACSEIGLNLIESIKVLSKNWESNISIEFIRLNLEVQLGKGVREALEDLSYRLDIPKVSHFITLLIQGDYLGTPLPSTLSAFREQLKNNHQVDNNTDQVVVAVSTGFSIVLFIAILVLGQALILK